MLIRSVCGLAALATIASLASAEAITYNPGLGTLPQAQGWEFNGTYNAPMGVAGGILTYGATTVGGTTYWGFEPIDSLNFATTTATVEADLKLSGSDFGNFSGYRRAGFSLILSDDFGRWIIADLGDNTIGIGNDDPRTGDPTASVNLTGDFHRVKLEAGPAGGKLYVDGVLKLSLALGTGRSGGAAVNWGDGTVLANATQTQIREVVYIPTPGSFALASIGGLLLGSRRR